MEPSRPPSMGKRLWHVVQVVFYMLRKSISKQKLAMDLNLLLQRGKLAGKALGNFLHHDHHGGGGGASFSCRSLDPDVAFYNPRDVEFSCSNTPAFPSLLHVPTKRNRSKNKKLDAAAVAKAFEMLNLEMPDEAAAVVAAAATPSPAMWGFGRSPMVVRQLRITDSPFPVKEEGEADGRVDREADDFIKRFYEQLQRQQLLPPTPEYGGGGGRHRAVAGRA